MEITLINPQMKLEEVCQYMEKNNLDYCLVSGSSLGILTTRDIIEAAYQYSTSYMLKLKASSLAKQPVISITPGTSIFEAIRMMLSHKVRRLPVISENKVVFVLTEFELMLAAFSYLSELSKRKKRI